MACGNQLVQRSFIDLGSSTDWKPPLDCDGINGRAIARWESFDGCCQFRTCKANLLHLFLPDTLRHPVVDGVHLVVVNLAFLEKPWLSSALKLLYCFQRVSMVSIFIILRMIVWATGKRDELVVIFMFIP